MEGENWGKWEDLRKEARKVEHSLDIKLASYSKIASEDASTKLLEIEQLLQRLSDVNRALADSQSRTDTHGHALARHRSILEEFTREFRRIRGTETTNRTHAELVGAFSRTHDQDVGSDGPSARGPFADTALLREHGAIYSNVAQIDEVLGQAQATSSALSAQRAVFSGITGKVNSLGAAFPAVNKILSNIRKRKSKDTLILSTTISICTLLLILYWLSK